MAPTPDPFRGNVSVIVLNYERARTTIECLDALARSRSELIRDIVVVDNGSGPEELALLRQRERGGEFLLVEVGENRFFSEGNNIGVDFARGDYLVFLNNDAFVEPGWIEALTDTMRSDPAVAAVGPLFVYPDGRVQEVGSLALPTGDIVQVGKGAVWGPDHYDTPCPVDFCSAACLLVRKDDFAAVGGFGFEWEPAYYEDADLCLKLWVQCGKVMVNPRARVVHAESTTTSDPSLRLHDISEINRAKFAAKWGPWLEARQTRHLAGPAPGRHAGQLPEPGTPRPVLGRSVTPAFVLHSPYPLVPGGGERVLLELSAHLSDLVGSDEVVFSSPHRYSTIRLRQIAVELGLDGPVGTPAPWGLVDPSRCRLGVVLGNSLVPPMPAFGERCVYLLQFPFWVPDEEVAQWGGLLSGYDEIWVYSDFVRRNVNGLVRHYGLSAPAVRVIPPPAAWTGAATGLPWAERRTVLSVGRFFAGAHNKRQDVVIEAFRRIADRTAASLHLALAGSIHPSPAGRERFHELQEMASGLDCAFHPNVTRSELATLYATSAVLIHATGFGVDPDEFPEKLEHFGITPVEAASFGCIPVVYGQGGPVDVLRELACDTTFDTVDECVRVVGALLDDPGRSTALSAQLVERSQAYSETSFRRRVDDALQDLEVLARGVSGALVAPGS